MQIHPEHATHSCPSPDYRLHGSDHACKKSSFQASDAPRESHGYWPTQTSISPKPMKAIAPLDPACSWREKVQGLFDPALRDAEDMMLSLPYTEIREKTNTLATVLDQRASSRPAGAVKTSLPKSRISSRTRRNGGHLSMAGAASENGNRSAAESSSSKHLAGRASLSQNSDSTVIAQTLCVASSSFPFASHANWP